MEQEEPGLGAFTAPLNTTVVAGTVGYTVMGTATFSPVTTPAGLRYNITGQMLLAQQMPPPPPPPVPLQVLNVTPNPVASGGTITLTGTGFAPGARVLWGTRLLPVTVVSSTSMTATAPVLFATTTAPLDVNVAGVDALGPPLTVLVGPVPPPPTPVPPGAINVRDFGAKGDGLADDTAACQHALQSVQAGGTLYFPAGVYKLSDQLKWNHPPQATIMGDGSTSVLHNVAGMGLYIGTGGETGGPVTVTKLKFQGNAGATMRSTILPSGGIQIYGPNNCVIDDCDFQDVMSAVFCAGPVGISQGTQIKNCRVNGWARTALFLNGGEIVANCTLTQTDPDLNGQQTSHGIYSHASNVTIQDTVVSNSRKYGCQIYSEDSGHAMDNVSILRCQFLNCHDGGLTLDHSQMGAGDIHNCRIDSCVIKGTYGGSALQIKNGDGVAVNNCTIDGSPSYGLAIGVFAPYDTSFAVQNVTVTGCTIKNCQIGLETYPSNGGTLSNILIQGNTISGNSRDIQQEGSTAGIKILP